MTGFLRQVSPKGPTLDFQYDPEQCEPVGGVGGWTSVDRPRRLAGTEFGGTPLLTLPFDLIFDRWVEGGTIEPIIAQLYAWGAPVSPGKEPAVLQLGYGVFSKLRWVLNDVSISGTIRRPDGQRAQARISITLLEYQGLTPRATAADSVRSSIIAANTSTGQTQKNPVAKTYTTKKGDTLHKIAAALLGNANRWTEIKTLNGLKGTIVVKPGMKLKLPPK